MHDHHLFMSTIAVCMQPLPNLFLTSIHHANSALSCPRALRRAGVFCNGYRVRTQRLTSQSENTSARCLSQAVWQGWQQVVGSNDCQALKLTRRGGYCLAICTPISGFPLNYWKRTKNGPRKRVLRLPACFWQSNMCCLLVAWFRRYRDP